MLTSPAATPPQAHLTSRSRNVESVLSFLEEHWGTASVGAAPQQSNEEGIPSRLRIVRPTDDSLLDAPMGSLSEAAFTVVENAVLRHSSLLM